MTRRAAFFESLRTGAFLTPERLRLYPIILLAFYAVVIATLMLGGRGPMDAWNRPVGTDFSEVYAAGVFVREGEPTKPFDNEAHFAKQRAIFGPETPFYAWGYPPYFLLLAGLLAALPYLAALAVWQATTLAAYLTVIRRLLPGPAALMGALAFPAVLVNLTHGHNGFLTAALLGGGAVLLPRRPWIAGLLFGALVYKPQFATLVPVALLAVGAWRTIVAAALTAAALTLVTVAAFGVETWQAFIGSIPFSQHVIVEQGVTGWQKLQTVFAAARMLGAGVSAAYGLQTAATLAAAAAVAVVWRWAGDHRLKVAILLAAPLLATPYGLDYDMMVLGPALAAMVSYGLDNGFRPFEKTVLAIVWTAPLVARGVAGVTDVPVGLLAMIGLAVLIVARTLVDRRQAAVGLRTGGWRAASA